jgi:hypothetical protein
MQKNNFWLKKSFVKYLLGALIIIVPLYPKFPLFAIPGTYVAIRFEDLILLVLGIITFVAMCTNIKESLKNEITIAFLIFFGVNLISLLSGVFLTKTAGLSIGLFNYFRRIEYLIPFFAINTLLTNKQAKEYLGYYVKLLIIVVVTAFVYGLGQMYLAFPIIITQNDQYAKGVALRWTPGSHISSTFAGHYDLAAVMVMLLPIFISIFFVLKNKWDKTIAFTTVCSGIWLLINSLSRISQVSYLAATFVVLFILKKYKALGLVLVISIVLIAQSSSLNARFYRVIDVFYQKIMSIKIISLNTNFVVRAESETLPSLRVNLPTPTPSPVPVFEDRSTSIRLKVEWPRALRAFEINPLLGTGYSSISLATDNDFLRMLGETGLLGFLAFVLIFLRIGKVFIKVYRKLDIIPELERVFIVGTFAAIVGTFISAFFIDLFEASKFATLFWFMVGYAVFLAKNYIDE